MLILWAVASGEEIRRFDDYKYRVRSAAFTPDGQAVLSVSHDVVLWDVTTGELIYRLEYTHQGVISKRVYVRPEAFEPQFHCCDNFTAHYPTGQLMGLKTYRLDPSSAPAH